MKNILTQLARNVLKILGLKATASAARAGIHEKVRKIGSCASKTFGLEETLII